MRRTADDIQDEWLVLRWQSGERAALPELAARWHGRLYRHARRLVDHADAADDVVQEAWLAIVRGLSRLDDPARFGPWAYRIVTNKCADWTRRRVRDNDKAHRAEATSASSAAALNERVDESTDDRAGDETLLSLRAAMRDLSPTHRATLALHYLDGLDVAQIAFAMSVPPGTVKSRLHHARERLRALIESEHDNRERAE